MWNSKKRLHLINFASNINKKRYSDGKISIADVTELVNIANQYPLIGHLRVLERMNSLFGQRHRSMTAF